MSPLETFIWTLFKAKEVFQKLNRWDREYKEAEIECLQALHALIEDMNSQWRDIHP